jgi:hypothetical protein
MHITCGLCATCLSDAGMLLALVFVGLALNITLQDFVCTPNTKPRPTNVLCSASLRFSHYDPTKFGFSNSVKHTAGAVCVHML